MPAGLYEFADSEVNWQMCVGGGSSCWIVNVTFKSKGLSKLVFRVESC